MRGRAVAIGLGAVPVVAAHRYAKDLRHAFDTWKIEVPGGFASAILLLGVVALMVHGSIGRLIKPEPIHHQEARGIGLIVNLVRQRGCDCRGPCAADGGRRRDFDDSDHHRGSREAHRHRKSWLRGIFG